MASKPGYLIFFLNNNVRQSLILASLLSTLSLHPINVSLTLALLFANDPIYWLA